MEITYKAFELVPDGPTTPTVTTLEALSKRTRQPAAQVNKMIESTTKRAKGLGLESL